MASPLSTGKKTVNLATDGVRVSRIRRDPPPKVVEKPVNPDEIDRRDAVIGILIFTMAIFVIILGISAYTGRSPREYILQL